jgi:hypothetical protein
MPKTTAILSIAKHMPLMLKGVISVIITADMIIEINQEIPTLN